MKLKLKPFLWILALALIVGGVWSARPKPRRPVRLRAAIDAAVQSLVSLNGADGKFVYSVDLSHPETELHEYNNIRHAGTIFALANYARIHPSPEVTKVIGRGLHYMRMQMMQAVEGPEKMQSVLSQDVKDLKYPVARLGGTGLGLVAVANAQPVLTESEDPDLGLQLGRFLLFMQKPDGSFYSMYDPVKKERSDLYPSLYYPGEALLGLILLYKNTRDVRWLEAAGRGLEFLARSRQSLKEYPPDNWALVATREFLAVEHPLVERRRDLLLHHALHIAKDERAGQILTPETTPFFGCYTGNGETTPTSTRLEGLLATLFVLPKEMAKERLEIEGSARVAMGFLLRAQIDEGRFAGAFPQVMASRWSLGQSFSSGRLRIDYTQHALSAMLAFEQLGLVPLP